MNASSSRDASLVFTVRALDRGCVVEAYSDHLASVGLYGSQVPVAAKGATRPGPSRKSGNGSAHRVNELDKILDAEAQTAVLAENKQLFDDAGRGGTWPKQESCEMEKDQWWDPIHIVVPGATWSGSSSDEHSLHAAFDT